MATAALTLEPGGKASPLWMVAYFVIVTIGELHLGPVGLALVSRMAPARVLSLMMGLWLAASFPGEILGGWLGGFWSSMEKVNFFLMIGAIAAVGGAAVLALNPVLRTVFDEMTGYAVACYRSRRAVPRGAFARSFTTLAHARSRPESPLRCSAP